jgi:hypothetical protein
MTDEELKTHEAEQKSLAEYQAYRDQFSSENPGKQPMWYAQWLTNTQGN